VKRVALILALVLVGGCSSERDAVRKRDAALLAAEIANLGSQAKLPGKRSPAQLAATTAQVSSMQAHALDLGRP